MRRKLSSILLIDDDKSSNYFHRRILEKMEVAEQIDIAQNGQEGLNFLMRQVNGGFPCPDIIFLDINMPVLNGWEFLNEYAKLNNDQTDKISILMLSSSSNPDDLSMAEKNKNVNGFLNKFPNKDALEGLLRKNFPDHY